MPYNPFAAWPITGTWAEHMSYSLGGTDYPLAYGTAIRAPATGTLDVNGWTGTAGRRSTLWLDDPISIPGLPSCHAVVFQHQSAFGVDGKHYDEREPLGLSGASASGNDWGGQVHLHVHGLVTASPEWRLPFELYFNPTARPSSDSNPLPIGKLMALKDTIEILHAPERGYIAVAPGFVYEIGDKDGVGGQEKLDVLGGLLGVPVVEASTRQWDVARVVFRGNEDR